MKGDKMKKRYAMKKKASKTIFRKTADKTHKFNVTSAPIVMRGGIRM